jgi:hypothetical protein
MGLKFKRKLQKGMKISVDRAKKTRLYVLETSRYALGNASVLTEYLSLGVQTVAGSVSARNAAMNFANAAEDFACSDYICLILDTTATVCDITGSCIAFIPNNSTKKMFGVTTSVSCFCRTLRNQCKEKNIFNCK